jgi:hypothetical protein
MKQGKEKGRMGERKRENEKMECEKWEKLRQKRHDRS